MNINLEYLESRVLKAKSVAVIGEFNDFDPTKGIMTKSGNKWTFSCDLPEGKYKYKFLINDSLRLNDSEANIFLPDSKDILWSTIIIDSDGKRLYNNESYHVHIANYTVCAKVSEEFNISMKKKFILGVNDKAVVRFNFQDVSGMHAVTVAWYNPKGDLVEYAENNLMPTENNRRPSYLWFWLELNEKRRDRTPGRWTMRLFLDGDFVLEDRVELI